MKKTLLFLFHCLFSTVLLSQQILETSQKQTQSFIPISPAARGFGIFNQVPVSLYTGIPDISIPLHNIMYKELKVNLTLQYHPAVANKPDLFPGVTGNGFFLNVGGVITRAFRGTTSSDKNGQASQSNNPTASDTWSTTASMQNYIKNQTDLSDDAGQYDEYTYNFGGKSGSFYTDHNKEIKIKTTDGDNIKVEKQAVTSYTFSLPQEEQIKSSQYSGRYRNTITATNFIYKFILTDKNGIKYTFGGTNESIELSRPGGNCLPLPATNEAVIPTNWYLTSIESPNGYKIELQYSREKFHITYDLSFRALTVTPANWSNENGNVPQKDIRATLYNSCHLDKIITPDCNVKFNWSKADNQLRYPLAIDSSAKSYFQEYYDIGEAEIKNRFPNKLDSIEVFTNQNERRKGICFGYTNSTTTRLKLLSVKLKGENASTNNYTEYKFEYNTLALPDYATLKTDAYGFYNGKTILDPNETPNNCYNLFRDATWRQNYINSKNADTAYLKAELLKKITYPTGGYTEYEFESNQYGRVARYWPASVTENPSGVVNAGGLRIKRITTYDGTQSAIEKKYYYVSNYANGGTVSSGVLNYEPRYFRSYTGSVTAPASKLPDTDNRFTGNIDLFQFNTNGINPASYNYGNPVCYSEVAEVNKDGGFTVCKYKNYDNGYHNNPAENMLCDNANIDAFWKEDDMNSMDLERGQILSQEIYNKEKTLKSSVKFLYNDDNNRFQNNVRRLKAVLNPVGSYTNYPSLRYTANLIYTYYPYLKSKIVYTSDEGGSTTDTTVYSYNNNYRLLTSQTSTNSTGQSEIISFKYPFDFSGTAVYDTMVKRNIVAAVVEQTGANAAKELMRTKYNFALWNNSKFAALSSIQQSISGKSFRNEMVYNLYDETGNPLEYRGKDGVTTALVWGYNNTNVIAKVIGTDYNTVAGTISMNTVNKTSDEQILRTELSKLKNIPSSFYTINTYKPLVGKTSETDVNGNTTYYEYDGLGRLQTVRDNNKNIVKSMCYNYAGQPAACPVAGQPVYLKMVQDGEDEYLEEAEYYPWGQMYAYGNYSLHCYADKACTIPVKLPNNLKVNQTLTTYNFSIQNGEITQTVSNNPQTYTIPKGADNTGCNGSYYERYNGNTYPNSTGSYATSTLQESDNGEYILVDPQPQYWGPVYKNAQEYTTFYGSCQNWYSNDDIRAYYKGCALETGTQPYYVTVPAGKYISAISKADANKMAANDAQDQANKNGKCNGINNPVNVTIDYKYAVECPAKFHFVFYDYDYGQSYTFDLTINRRNESITLPFGYYYVEYKMIEDCKGPVSLYAKSIETYWAWVRSTDTTLDWFDTTDKNNAWISIY